MTDLVKGLIVKGFSRRDAVFLARAIMAGVGQPALREEVGVFGIECVYSAIRDLEELGANAA